METKWLTPSERRALVRTDLYAFTERCFYELNPTIGFLWNWHIEVIAAELEKVRRGETKRLIINVPPRSLKSISASVAFPAFLLGHDPAAQIICASYGQDLANKHALDCRRIMTSGWFRDLFPRTRLSERQAVHEFETKQHGFRLSTSVGGPLTGRGADCIIIDDPSKPEEALSDTQRNAVNEWFDHTLYSRLNDKRTGRIVLIMQRLHEDDLVGHVQQIENWRVLKFPAIAEENECYEIQTPYGPRRFERKVGEALHPEREPLGVLNRLREALGEYNFAGQYQQAPAPLGGGYVKEEWFKTYLASGSLEFEYVFQSWDSANKSTELSDYSVCTTWGVKEKNVYLLNVFRKRLDYPDLKRAVSEQAKAFDAQTILIEDAASGTQLIQDLIRDGVHAVKRCAPTKDKRLRMYEVTDMIENGFVYLPDAAHWRNEYLHELVTFPESKHDDQVDSTSQALQWFKQRPTSLGWFEEMGKRAMAEAEAEKSATFERPITRGELLGRGAPSATAQNRREGKKVDGKAGNEKEPDAPGPVTYYPDGRDKKKKLEGPGPVIWRPPETEED